MTHSGGAGGDDDARSHRGAAARRGASRTRKVTLRALRRGLFLGVGATMIAVLSSGAAIWRAAAEGQWPSADIAPAALAASWAHAADELSLPAGDAPGSRERRYIVHAPDGLADRPEDAAPPALVALLHGCRQTHRDIMAASRFVELADANAADRDPSNDFIVVFPFVTSYPSFWIEPRAENCWGWWIEDQRREGAGEAGDLARLLSTLEAEFGTDPARRYVAGLSSGAAMAVALGVVESETIAAVGSVAGVPYGETADAVAIAWPLHYAQSFWLGADANCFDRKTYRPVGALVTQMRTEQLEEAEQKLVPLMVIQSANDCTVDDANAYHLKHIWLSRYEGVDEPVLRNDDQATDCSSDGVRCRHRRYDGPDGRVVETVLYDGRRFNGTHYWVGDNEGAPYSEADGPSATCLLLGFFDLAPRAAGAC